MTNSSPSPIIGVFDSGFGGLTVLRSLLARMPGASFAFIGDTARLPYGSKSRRTIARYAAESAQFLTREQGAEFLVIACNTASALALDAIQASVPGIPVLGVIAPGAEAARAASNSGDVLVIATDATVQSHAYAAACEARGLRALEKACPLLVPLVEEGWTTAFNPSTNLGASGPASAIWESTDLLQPNNPQVDVTREVIRIYLDELLTDARSKGMQPDTLVLGCTHYPLLRPLLEEAVPPGMRVIDSADSTAAVAAQQFSSATDAQKDSPAAQVRCFATDSVEKFECLGSRFLGRSTGPVTLVDLGG
ncbi:MAG TPA: aspartate/glutamate racemase family protein [Terracidiphilus sp.]|nr:aspartate/glutamate racemase family protein [Terracidiphilus sp.]